MIKQWIVNYFLIFSLSFIFFGCATSSVFIDTLPPGAEVYMSTGGTTGENILLGTSPIQLTHNEIVEKFNSNGPLNLFAKKEGFESTQTYVTEIPNNSDLHVTLSLKNEMDADRTLKMNKTLDMLFESQRLVKVGRYEDAIKQLQQIQTEYPYLSAPMEMQGGIYYIQKDYTKALDSYQKASRLNPQNTELVSMKRYLEKVKESVPVTKKANANGTVTEPVPNTKSSTENKENSDGFGEF